MSNNSENDKSLLQVKQIIQQAIKSWDVQNRIITAFFDRYEDDFYYNTVAPGRNRGIYILGHLVAMSDGLLPVFGVGERLFPELEPIFISTPDNVRSTLPPLGTLKKNWRLLNENLSQLFNVMEPDEWLAAHTKVSAEDFKADPLRNKLNVLLSRTVHLGYHAGQLSLMTPKI